MGVCLVDGCKDKAHGRGYCDRHYRQVLKHSKIISLERIKGHYDGIIKRVGYIYILKKGHPLADAYGYVKRSWLVFEENTGHIVQYPEVVHHINGNKEDDRFENLKLLPNKKAHVIEHGGRIGGVRIVTKEMAIEEMKRVVALIGEPLTTRSFQKISSICPDVIRSKFGWNKLKEELCIR